ncbi:hypothetical protein B0H16DRAFT_1467441 [Mycena metata]|uniref:KOW domain-containing protein n=1 Tax=Mycena metata TaxID=1033252 RepID=A0AAD7MXD1_9AGAR|nr:hypothetical protein B0H16DRAFT_1467441 [Mycena metata]
MPSRSPYIDDRAEEVPDAEMNDGPSDGESDSEEARVRRQDRELFKMPEILVTHEARLREAGPYCIPTHLLPSGAATPARHEDQLKDMPSRAPSPTIPLLPPIQTGSRAPTPDYIPFNHTHDQPHSFPPSMEQLRQRTPLFLADPDSRGPPPFSQRGESWGPTPAVPQLRLQMPLFHDPPVPAQSPSKHPPACDPTSDPDTDPDTEREDTERKDDERSTNSGPPPCKKLKTSHFKAAFLDLAAELSGDDDDSGDDQNEDEETLSDKEFLDDEPIHDVVPAASFRPVADAPDDDGDELRAIARHYEDEAARELAAPSSACSTAPTDPSGCGVVDSPPRRAQLRHVGARGFTAWRRPPLSAFAPGDRVVVVSGEFQHKTGQLYLWSLREVLRDSKRVRMARIAEFKDGRDKLGRFDVEVCHLKRHIPDAFCPIQMHDRVCVVSGVLHRGLSGQVTDLSDGLVGATDGELEFTVDVHHVVRDLRCGDVVRVIRGQFTGSGGLIVHIGLGGSLEIWDISSNAIPQAERSENSNTENLSDEVQAQLLPVRARNVELVDYQMAVYSASYTRTSEIGAWVPLETAPTEPDDPEREHLRQERRVQEQKLNKYNKLRAPYDEEKTWEEFQDRYISKIAELSQRLAIPLTAADMNDIARVAKKLGRPLTAADNNDFAEISKRLGLPLTTGDVHERDRCLKDTELKFAYTGHRFEGIDVKVIKGPNKGVHGVVVADHDSAERVKHLGNKGRRAQDRNAKGIVLTVRKEASNQRILVHIEDAQHLYSKTSLHKARNLPEAVLKGNRPKREPPPQVVDDVYLQGPLEPAAQEHYPKLDMPLVGEGDGTWVRAPEFRHVRIDVRLSGLNTIPKVSDKILKLEGHNGYLLAGDKSNNGKIIVRGAGKTAVAVSIPPACVKPRRTDDDGHRLNEVQLRVVVVGPDQVGSTADKGKYGFTVPARSTAELVKVQFPGSLLTGQFPYASLCLAKNIAIQTLTHNFVEIPVPAM